MESRYGIDGSDSTVPERVKGLRKSVIEKMERLDPEDKPRKECEEDLGDVMIPSEEVVELKKGRKKISTRKFFPGYILVNMIMTEESWYVVRNTPGS